MTGFTISKHRSWMEDGRFCTSALLECASQPFELYFKTSEGPLCTGIEPFVAAALLPAMKVGVPVYLPGGASCKLLAGVNVIQEIFRCWFPDFTSISIQPRSAPTPPAAPTRQAASFFSGGVDSFYTLLKRRDEIDKLILVHGFDFHLKDQGVRDRVSRAMRAAARELGKSLIEVETNVQQFSEQFLHWNFYHGAALASVALLLSPLFGRIYVPSSHTYADAFPWGSHPLVDPLWGIENLTIVHDGCEATRVDKLRFISASETALKYLRVCYQNRKPEWQGAYNCGQCEKCLRTKVNLCLVGALERCATLDHSFDLRDIASMPVPNENAAAYVRENLEAARALNADPALISALQRSLDGHTRPAAVRLQEENSVLKATLEAIYRSWSWRGTAPLRKLKVLFRKVRFQ
jgi:7-cyano-7-deazaguanine synthase in queuosine biosynthesis